MKDFLLASADARIRWIEIPGDAPVRIYLHGLGCSSAFDFAHIAAHPTVHRAGRRSLLVDMLGFGASDRPGDFGYSLDDHAAIIAELMDHLGIRAADFVGHSMGGSVAIVLAARRPDLVSRLVVAEPNLRAGGGVWSKTIAGYPEPEYVATGHRAFTATCDASYAARMRIADPLAVHRSACGLVIGSDPEMMDMLVAFPGPRTYVVGAQNRPDPDEVAVAAAGVVIREVADAEHAMMLDNPDGFAAIVAEALA